nr:PrsW family glutamic-type intramembrane protease [Treponema socranskii]
MNIYAALALCFVPFFVMFSAIRRFAHVGIIVMLYAALLGLLAVAPISILQFYAADIPFLHSDHWITQLLRAILFNGFIEEFIKIIFILFLPSKRLSLGKFFLCACICGMSLGCFESAIYFLQHLQQANTIGAHLIYVQMFERMFTSDAVHALCAGLGGLFIRSVKRMRIDIAAVLFAPLLHGLYDFFALYDDFKRFSVAAILLFGRSMQDRLYESGRRKKRGRKNTGKNGCGKKNGKDIEGKSRSRKGIERNKNRREIGKNRTIGKRRKYRKEKIDKKKNNTKELKRTAFGKKTTVIS